MYLNHILLMEEKVLKNSNFPTQTIKKLTKIYNKSTNRRITLLFTFGMILSFREMYKYFTVRFNKYRNL